MWILPLKLPRRHMTLLGDWTLQEVFEQNCYGNLLSLWSATLLSWPLSKLWIMVNFPYLRNVYIVIKSMFRQNIQLGTQCWCELFYLGYQVFRWLGWQNYGPIHRGLYDCLLFETSTNNGQCSSFWLDWWEKINIHSSRTHRSRGPDYSMWVFRIHHTSDLYLIRCYEIGNFPRKNL